MPTYCKIFFSENSLNGYLIKRKQCSPSMSWLWPSYSCYLRNTSCRQRGTMGRETQTTRGNGKRIEKFNQQQPTTNRTRMSTSCAYSWCWNRPKSCSSYNIYCCHGGVRRWVSWSRDPRRLLQLHSLSQFQVRKINYQSLEVQKIKISKICCCSVVHLNFHLTCKSK